MRPAQPACRPAGFTLTELLIVIAILLLISAVALPTALVAMSERSVSEAANIVQANFSLTHSRAVSAGEAAGVRLLPDPDLFDPTAGTLASNRMIALSSLPDYSSGTVIPELDTHDLNGDGVPDVVYLVASEQKFDGMIPVDPTGWYFNIRQGDMLRFGDSGLEYRVAGPMTSFTSDGTFAGARINPERFVNLDDPITGASFLSVPGVAAPFEFLRLLNGLDDDGDGYIDEAFDGIDNDGDGFTDPGFNGLDDNGDGTIDEPAEMLIGSEFEFEDFRGALASKLGEPVHYSIRRRPLVAPDAREISLPSAAVIDLTTSPLLGSAERSRVPIDPLTGFVDLLIFPNGEVVPSTPFGLTAAKSGQFPTFHLWIAQREDVVEPLGTVFPRLPFPRALSTIPGVPAAQSSRPLEGDRRLVSIVPNTGHVSVSEIPDFAPSFNVPNTDLTAVDINGDGREETRGADVPFLEPARFLQTGE